MNKFLQGSELNAEIEKLIKNANNELFLVSPYIKLHDRIKDQLKLKRNNTNLKITIVYGKSEDGVNKISANDLAFLKGFPHIEIRYEKNLHAKYYANEAVGLVTSMNLYDFSFNNNIEVGILISVVKLGTKNSNDKLETEDLHSDAHAYFSGVIQNAELLYHKLPEHINARPAVNDNKVGAGLIYDIIDNFHEKPEQRVVSSSQPKKYGETHKVEEQMGYCIRYGHPIPFNIEKPYSEKAYQSWARYENEEYPEKYCHFSGEQSDGFTCYINPVLKKNWREAKKVFKF